MRCKMANRCHNLPLFTVQYFSPTVQVWDPRRWGRARVCHWPGCPSVLWHSGANIHRSRHRLRRLHRWGQQPLWEASQRRRLRCRSRPCSCPDLPSPPGPDHSHGGGAKAAHQGPVGVEYGDKGFDVHSLPSTELVDTTRDTGVSLNPTGDLQTQEWSPSPWAQAERGGASVVGLMLLVSTHTCGQGLTLYITCFILSLTRAWRGHTGGPHVQWGPRRDRDACDIVATVLCPLNLPSARQTGLHCYSSCYISLTITSSTIYTCENWCNVLLDDKPSFFLSFTELFWFLPLYWEVLDNRN